MQSFKYHFDSPRADDALSDLHNTPHDILSDTSSVGKVSSTGCCFSPFCTITRAFPKTAEFFGFRKGSREVYFISDTDDEEESIVAQHRVVGSRQTTVEDTIGNERNTEVLYAMRNGRIESCENTSKNVNQTHHETLQKRLITEKEVDSQCSTDESNENTEPTTDKRRDTEVSITVDDVEIEDLVPTIDATKLHEIQEEATKLDP